MGTASAMACILAALGLMPLKGATAPAVSAARLRIAEETGARAVALARTQLRPQALLSRESFLKPSGSGYMTDFHDAGGMPALLHALAPLLHLSALTTSGQMLGQLLAASPHLPLHPTTGPLARTIRPLATPLRPRSSLVVLTGNLAPHGAVLKASAAKLAHHTGPALVFAGAADLVARIDDPALPVTRDSVLVLRGIGPAGHPGMPEAGMVPIPQKLAARGVEDPLRVSDGRMSGTAGGTVVLHVSPEAARPDSALAVVRDGDRVTCDVERRILRLEVADEEIRARLEERRREMEGRRVRERGYRGLYMRSVNQAEEGAGSDFLTAAGPSAV